MVREQAGNSNIVIADHSAFYALMHSDWSQFVAQNICRSNPLARSAATIAGLTEFNLDNPHYGARPISLLVPAVADRRNTEDIICRYCSAEYPAHSFFRLRAGLYMASPELVFVRMASMTTEIQLAEIAMNLCGRYYIEVNTREISRRSSFLTTPKKLSEYAHKAAGVRGAKKAINSLRWVLPNTGSPFETKMKLLFCHPLGRGGFALPFTAMNYDVKAGKLEAITAQSEYSIDMVDEDTGICMEYDGEQYHLDQSVDKRRRNELKALGWDIFPLDKAVLNDPDATIRLAMQIAKTMGVRIRRSNAWMGKYVKLRKELNLPV